MKNRIHILALAILAMIAVSCATQKKIKDLHEGKIENVQLSLSNEVSNLPEMRVQQITRDTLMIKDDDGSEILIMKAVKDWRNGRTGRTRGCKGYSTFQKRCGKTR